MKRLDVEADLKRLGLHHMAARWTSLADDEAFSEPFGALVRAEVDGRNGRRQERRLLDSGLPMPSASWEDLWRRPSRRLPTATLDSLADGQWVAKGQHVALTGATGRGKTWLACALAQQVVRAGLTVRFFDVPDLLAEWEAAQATGRLPKFRRLLDRSDLLVLDDWAVESVDAQDVAILRRVLLHRLKDRSVLLSSPHPRAAWNAWLGDAYEGEALLDRFDHAAHTIQLKGPSLR